MGLFNLNLFKTFDCGSFAVSKLTCTLESSTSLLSGFYFFEQNKLPGLFDCLTLARNDFMQFVDNLLVLAVTSLTV